MIDKIHTSFESLVLDKNNDFSSFESNFSSFNIFEAINYERAEIRHSRFLSFILNPYASHSFGDAFLKIFMQSILAPLSPENRPVDLIELSLSDLSGSFVYAEYHNIDILIRNDDLKFIVIIENKIDAKESKGQLEKYREYIESNFEDYKKLFIYLTPFGDEPSDGCYEIHTYSDILNSLKIFRRKNKNSILPNVLTIIEQYISLLGSHIVPDEELIRKAKIFYQMHSVALNFIFENKPDHLADRKEWLCKLIEGDKNFILDRNNKRFINFRVADWENIDIFSSLSNNWTTSKKGLMFELCSDTGYRSLKLVLGPLAKSSDREAVFSFCSSAQKGIFKNCMKHIGSSWVSVYIRTMADKIQEETDERRLEGFTKQFSKKWEVFLKRDFREIRNAIIDEYGAN